MDEELQRRLGRIEHKLDERVVYTDVYEADRRTLDKSIESMALLNKGALDAIRESFQQAAEQMMDSVGAIKDDVDRTERQRETDQRDQRARNFNFMVAVLGLTFSLIGIIIVYVLQRVA